ncbi:hypothetical protein ACVWXO_006359 [Bradyrhizobium sp. LM2.7]
MTIILLIAVLLRALIACLALFASNTARRVQAVFPLGRHSIDAGAMAHELRIRSYSRPRMTMRSGEQQRAPTDTIE